MAPIKLMGDTAVAAVEAVVEGAAAETVMDVAEAAAEDMVSTVVGCHLKHGQR